LVSEKVYTAAVTYECSFNEISRLFQPKDNFLTVTALLIGFFRHFLINTSDPISISHNTGPLSRATYLSQLDKSLAKTFKEHTFLVLDPFDRSYNPGRHVGKGSYLETMYL